MVKSRIRHKEPIMGSPYTPYWETNARDFGLYLWWAFCFINTNHMIEYIIGFAWMGIVAWATILTLLSKKLSWVEKVVICSAIIFSFYLAAFVEDSYYERIFTDPDSEYVLASLNFLT